MYGLDFPSPHDPLLSLIQLWVVDVLLLYLNEYNVNLQNYILNLYNHQVIQHFLYEHVLKQKKLYFRSLKKCIYF